MKSAALLLLGIVSLTSLSCQSSTKPNKKVPVPPSYGQDASGLSWSRPQKFESGGGLGNAMPQSR